MFVHLRNPRLTLRLFLFSRSFLRAPLVFRGANDCSTLHALCLFPIVDIKPTNGPFFVLFA